MVLSTSFALRGFSVSRQSIEQVHLFMIRVQKSASLFLGVCSKIFVTHFIPPWGNCKKCPSIKFFIKGSASQTEASSQLAQSVFPLGYYCLLNKRLIIFEFFTHTSKDGVVILVFRPREVIRAFMSVFFYMLDILIKSNEHVLGPPRVSFDFEKK